MSARAASLVRCAVSLALLACAVGCDQLDLPKSWALSYPRVLGVRAEVVGDEVRATPEPGEQVRVRALIVGREPVERLSYALAACPTVPSNGELPSCAGEPFAIESGAAGEGEDAPFAGELAVELALPAAGALEGFEHVLVAAAACTDGDVRVTEGANEPECRGGDEPALSWTSTIALARDEDERNANPELAGDAIAFDEKTWLADADEDGEPPVRVKTDGELHTIRMRLQDSGRERVDGEREELLISHFASAGVLQRRFSVLESSDPDDRILTIEWRSPKPAPDKKLPAEAKLVFVLRDQRGGVAFTERRVALDRE